MKIDQSPGVRLMLLSTLLFAGMNARVKQLHHLPALKIIFFRALFSIVASYAALWRLGAAPFGNSRGLLLSQGSTGAVALTRAYPAERLRRVAPLNYLGILYALGLGYTLFGESFGALACAGIGLVLAGVGLNAWYTGLADARATVVAPAE